MSEEEPEFNNNDYNMTISFAESAHQEGNLLSSYHTYTYSKKITSYNENPFHNYIRSIPRNDKRWHRQNLNNNRRQLRI